MMRIHKDPPTRFAKNICDLPTDRREKNSRETI
jgi:hypothetical protein